MITECSVQRRWYINLDQLAINFIICVIVQTAVLCRPASNHMHACAPCAPRPYANRRPPGRYRCQARAGGGRHAQEARGRSSTTKRAGLVHGHIPILPTSLVPAPAGCAVVLLRARVHTCQLQTSPCMSRRGRHTRLNSLFNLQDYTLVCVPSSRLRFLCADFTFYVFEVF